MILKADSIAERLSNDDPSKASDPSQIDPFLIVPQPNLEELKNSGAASVDLRLGTWFMTLRESRMASFSVSDPKLQARISNLTRTYYVSFGKRFVLHPGSFVLAATLEWIRLPNNLAGYVVGRSSCGRLGLVIATAAGVHPGFTGCLTLELSNLGQVPLEIIPGMSICQLFLHTVQVGSKKTSDKSKFAGRRRPALASIELDAIAQRLAAAHS